MKFDPDYRLWSRSVSSANWDEPFMSHMHGRPLGSEHTRWFRAVNGHCPECGEKAPTLQEYYAELYGERS